MAFPFSAEKVTQGGLIAGRSINTQVGSGSSGKLLCHQRFRGLCAWSAPRIVLYDGHDFLIFGPSFFKTIHGHFGRLIADRKPGADMPVKVHTPSEFLTIHDLSYIHIDFLTAMHQ
jgi:hypothetical protein